MQVGDRLKAIRLHSGMTLAELSRDAGVSKSMLSRIERNDSAPTTTTLHKIASALGVDLASLFTDLDAGDATASPDRSAPPVIARDRSLDADATRNGNGAPAVSVVREPQRKRLIMPWGAAYEMLCPDMQHAIEFIQIAYPVGGGSDDFYSHDGEECGVVLEGRFKGIVGDQEFILEVGDSVYYSSSIPHRWENAGEVEAKAIWAVTPPSF
jgi:transcriptional regulator with XRE-family HTH domain